MSRSFRWSLASCAVLAGLLEAGAACNALLGNEPILFEEAGLDAGADTARPAPPDAGPDLPDAACAGEECERVVFVTSASYQGALGGIAGADALCKKAAEGEGSVVRGRTFVAWISDSFTFASTRHVHGTKSYKRTDGRAVAGSFAQLVSGALFEPIDHDETGALRVASPAECWTGTEANGDRRVPNCGEWLMSSPATNGTAGTWSVTDGGWSANRLEHACSTPAALYCIER